MAQNRTSWRGAIRRRHRRLRTGNLRRTSAVVLVGAAFAGVLIGIVPVTADPRPAPSAAEVSGCRATDGDTIRCGNERIRLLGIDAPELPGHCRKGRACAPGDPAASKASLAEALSGRLTVERVGTDRYGRTLALIASAKGDLSCWQLARRQAIYKPAWDDGRRVARSCPDAAEGR